MTTETLFKNIEDAFNETAPKFFEPYMETLNKYFDRNYGEGWRTELGVSKGTTPQLKLKASDYKASGGNVSFKFRVVFGTMELLSFCLDPYPACCAMWQINNFKYVSVVGDCVVECMNKLLQLVQKYYYSSLRRVVLNVVENPRWETERSVYSDYVSDYVPKYKFGDIPPLDETDMTKIKYPKIYTWAKSHKHQELLTVNHNTENIIHFMDVMINTL